MGPCCVEGCEVTSKETFYFEFPTSRLLRRKWLEVIPIPGKLPLGTVVCSRHFSEDDYESVRGKVRLKRKVVPTRLLDEKTTTPTDTPLKSPKSSKSPPKSPPTPPKLTDLCDSTTVSVPSPVDAEKMIDEIQKEKRSGDIGDKGKVSDVSSVCKVVQKENGRSGDGDKIVVKSPTLPDPKEDIEDMITNYHIKNKVPNTALLADIVPPDSDVVPVASDIVIQSQMEPIEIEDVKEAEPVFIEISVDKDTSGAGGESQDCLMLLESVQVDIDPTTLLLDQDEYYQEEEKTQHRRNDAISLLTSSDEDDVIIQEPHIDTVEVSDETDEDDVPLVKLVKNKHQKKKLLKKKTKKAKGFVNQIVWGMYDYYCMQCHFTTTNKADFTKHVAEHSKVLQVCPICGYTSASKTMFARHTRIHKVEKKFKCHLCDYRARHRMSLIYHVNNHDKTKLIKCTKDFKCKKCSFKSDIKAVVLKHMKKCGSDDKRHSCDKCDYATKKRWDLKRHQLRRHRDPVVDGGESDKD